MAAAGGSPVRVLELRRDVRADFFRQIETETQLLKTRQKKQSFYEYRPDSAKLPQIAGVTIDTTTRNEADLQNALLILTNPAAAASASPIKGKRPTTATDSLSLSLPVAGISSNGSVINTPAAAASTKGNTLTGPSSPKDDEAAALDDYDPKKAAENEVRAIRSEIIRLRDEASVQRAALAKAAAELETARTDLLQAQFEDNLSDLRKKGAEQIAIMEKRLEHVIHELDHHSSYADTLRFMITRMRAEKVDHTTHMRLLEEGLAVQRRELTLQERLKRQVLSALETEESNLRRMIEERRRLKHDLDDKIEGRRQEVITRQARQAEREKRMREEENLVARVAGDLTSEEEEQLKKRSSRMKGEAMLAARRLRFAVIKADQAEEEFNHLRVIAGATDEADTHDDAIEGAVTTNDAPPMSTGGSSMRYRPPNPRQILRRIAKIKEELDLADEQIADLTRRATHLNTARKDLREALQPRAVDPIEEDDVSREERATMLMRIADKNRNLESAREDFRRLSRLRVYLEQAVDAIHTRLANITPLHPMLRPPRHPEGASDWARAIRMRLHDSMERLVFIREEIDKAEAVRARSAADTMVDRSPHLEDSKQFEATLESVVSANEMGVRIPTRARSKALEVPMGLKELRGGAQKFATALVKDRAAADVPVIDSSPKLASTAASGFAPSAQPLAPASSSSGAGAGAGTVMSPAAGPTSSTPRTGTAPPTSRRDGGDDSTTDAADEGEFSRAAVMQRRRNSRTDIAEQYRQHRLQLEEQATESLGGPIAVAPPHPGSARGHRRKPRRSATSDADSNAGGHGLGTAAAAAVAAGAGAAASPAGLASGDAGAAAAAAAAASTKARRAPKTSEITKFLAAAVSQTGQSVPEDLLAVSEADLHEEMPSRVKIKAQAKADISAAMRAAAAAAAAAKATAANS